MQRLVEHDEGFADGFHDGLGVVARAVDLLETSFEEVDVEEREDRALDPIVHRAIRARPQQIPVAFAVLDLALAADGGVDDLPGDVGEIRHRQVGLDVPDRASDVRGNQVQQLLRLGRVSAQPSVGPQHDDRDARPLQGVLKVVVEVRQLRVPVLELLVDGRQLLVGRLELLLRGLELLVGRLELLVRRKDLLVGALELLVRRFLLLDDRLQVVLGGRQLLLELHDVLVIDGASAPGLLFRGRRPRGPAPRVGLFEEHQEVPAAASLRLQRDDFEVHLAEVAVLPDVESFLADGPPAPSRLEDRAAELDEQALAGHLEDVEARGAGRGFEVRARLSPKLNDLEGVVDQRSGRRVTAENQTVRLLLEVDRREPLRRRRRRGAFLGRPPLTEVEDLAGRARPFREDAMVAVHRHEEISETRDRLGVSEHENALRTQGVMEDRHDPLLQEGLQIDQQVAAADEIQVREGRIGRDVLAREDADVANALGDLPAPVGLDEETAPSLGLDVDHGVFQVDAGARLVDRGVGDVRREDLDGRAVLRFLRRLEESDRERVHLLAGGTSGDPDPDRRRLAAVLEE